LEGTNLYYTDSRARGAFSAGTGISYNSSTGVITSTITQYTDSLARGAVSASGSLAYNSSTGVFSYTTPSTTGITEGSNLYYTDARARAAISVTGSGSYNSTTGVITVTGGVTSVNTRTGAVTLTNVDVGLGSVENKSSATIRGEITSSNVTTALGFTPENSANRGVANGYATLNSSGQIPSSQLPSYVDDVLEAANLASFPVSGETGKIYVALDTNKTYRWSGSAYVYITSGAVDSVAGRTGIVTLTNSDVGLGSVENKSSATIRSEITSSNVTGALGFTPYNATNPSGYITGITSSNVTTALGFTPYNSTNPSGYITSSALSGYLTSATAASTYLPLSGGTMTGQLNVNNSGSATAVMRLWSAGSTIWNVGVGDSSGTNFNISADFGSLLINKSSGNVTTPGQFYAGTSNLVLHAGNYNSYAPTLTGTGASGTWNIKSRSINAVRTTNSNFNDLSTAIDTFTAGTNYIPSGGSYNQPADGDHHYLAWGGIEGSSVWAAQIDINFYSDRVWFRRQSGSSWQAWREFIHDGNYGSYALPLSGGTVTGDLLVQGTSSRFPSHFFHYEYDSAGNIYEHYYAPGSENVKNSTANLRVSSTSGYYKTLSFSGNGVFTWEGSTVLTAANYTSYAAKGTGTTGGADLNTLTTSGMYRVQDNEANRPGSYGQLLVMHGGSDTITQIYGQYDSGTLYTRSGNPSNIGGGGSWTSWKTLLDSSNYTSYSPSLTGSGASGTWGINITGSANTANSASNSNTVGGLAPAQFFNNMGNNHSTYTDFNNVPGFGAYYVQQGGNSPTGVAANQWYGFTLGLGNEYALSSYGTQLYWPRRAQNSNTYIYIRDREGGSWTSWNKIKAGYADSAGIVSYGNGSPAGISFTNTLAGVGTGRVVNFDANGNGTPSVWWTNGSRAYGAIDAKDPGLTFWANNGSSWQQQFEINYGNVTVNTDIRSPIFYDSSDTAYYTDPTATSRINSITIGNGASSYIQMLDDDSPNGLKYIHANSNLIGFLSGGGSWILRTDNNGTTYTDASFRAPIFYDLDNTSKYLDPNSWSSLSYITMSGHMDQYGPLYSYKDDVGLIVKSFNQSASSATQFNIRHNYADVIVENSRGWILEYASAVQTNNSYRAPVFYDSDSTNYYLNPNSESWIHNLSVQAGNENPGGANSSSSGLVLRGNYNSNTWAHKFHKMDVGGGVPLFLSWTVGTASWSALQSWGTGTGYGYTSRVFGSFSADSALYSPIFYDSDDTGYYVTPNGSSLVYNLRAASYMYVGNGSQMTINYDQIWRPDGGQLHLQYSAGGNINMCNGGGYAYIGGGGTSFRAPIFYDTNDTNYYSDPNGTSNLYDLAILGSSNKYVYINPGNGYEAMVRYNGGSGNTWYVGKRMSSDLIGTADFHFYSQAAGQTVAGVDASGNIFARGSSRAPVYYDSNDTAYYCDPAAFTYLQGGIANNGAHGSSYIYNRLLASNNGANSGEVRVQMWCSEPGNSWDYGGFGYNVDNTSNSNSPVYFFGRPNPNFGQAYMRFSTGGEWYFYNTNTTPTRYLTMQLHSSGYVTAFQSSRAPIFYDSDNTAYAVDPNGTSRMGTINADSLYSYGNVTAYSDERLKKDWETLPADFVKKLANVKSGTYTRIDSGERQVGVGAQSLQSILKEAVSDEQEYLGVNYGNAALASAVELAKEIVDLKTRVAELEALINKLILKD
jgi:hypothetical protein